MVIREDMVASGVNFLRHPKVQSAPLSQRVTFLEKKVGKMFMLFALQQHLVSRNFLSVDLYV